MGAPKAIVRRTGRAGPADRRISLLTANRDPSGGFHYVLRPNRSLSTRGMIWFVAGVGALALFIAVRFMLMGAWIVLPLTIVEISVLGIAFFLVARNGRRYERIDVDDGDVRVVRDDGRSCQEWHFQPYWVQVVLQPDPANWYPSRLYLRSHGKQLEIGNSLTDAERKQLSDELKRRLVRQVAPGGGDS